MGDWLRTGEENLGAECGIDEGRREGETARRDEGAMLTCADDLRGLTLRPCFPRMEPLVESKLPWLMSCRHERMRSEGGCVDVLSRRRASLFLDRMLLGLLVFDPTFFEKTEEVSQASVTRNRF